MAVGHFVWTDLSTFDMGLARKTCTNLFGWQFGGDTAYDFAHDARSPVAAVFPMPAPLVKINMPSFWMSYVQVENLDDMVAKARAHQGVIIEVEPESFGQRSRIALVRDPSGAGFTMVEGDEITLPTGPVQPGHVIRRYHHLPEISLIQSFYEDLFDWTFHKISEHPWPVFDIRHPDGTLVAQAEEVPKHIRGKFRYWMPCFAVSSDKYSNHGLDETNDLDDGRLMVSDPQGAALMVQAVETEEPSKARGPSVQGIPWKASLGLICIWLAVFLDLKLFWGVLFLMWSWPALSSGRADFIEPVQRNHNPVIFWGLTGTWIGLSLWLVAEALNLTG